MRVCVCARGVAGVTPGVGMVAGWANGCLYPALVRSLWLPCPLCHASPQILVANDKACSLLGYSSHDLIGQRLTQFFLKSDSHVLEALSEEHVEADGRVAVVSGTVVSHVVGWDFGLVLGRKQHGARHFSVPPWHG